MQFLDIEPAVKQAARWFDRLRRVHGIEMQELEQQARLIALRTVQAEPDKSVNPAYLFSAVRRSLGNYLSQQIAVVSIKGNWAAARTVSRRVPITVTRQGEGESGEEVLVSRQPGPEAPVFAQVDRRQHCRWRIDFHRALERSLRGLDDLEREIVELRFGLEGRTALSCAKIVEELYRQGFDVDVRFVYTTLERVIRRLRDSLDLAILDRRLEEIRR